MMDNRTISIPDEYCETYIDDIDEVWEFLQEMFSEYGLKNIRADFLLPNLTDNEYNCKFFNDFQGVDFGSSGSWSFYDFQVLSTSPFKFEADGATIIPYKVGEKYDV